MSQILRCGIATMAAAGALMLAGCNFEPGIPPESSSTPSPSTTSTPAPTNPAPTKAAPTTPAPSTSEPTPSASTPSTKLTTCDEFLPLADVQSYYGGDAAIDAFHSQKTIDDYLNMQIFDPLQAGVYGNAAQTLDCMWGYPASEALESMLVATLTPDARAALITDLEASGAVRSDEEDVVTFTREVPGIGPNIRMDLITDDVWVLAASGDPSMTLAQNAVSGLSAP